MCVGGSESYVSVYFLYCSCVLLNTCAYTPTGRQYAANNEVHLILNNIHLMGNTLHLKL